MKKKVQALIAAGVVAVVSVVPVFADVTGLMTSTSTTMTTTTEAVTTEPVSPEQNLPDYFIDLKDGLLASKDYNGITVGVDMPVKSEDVTEFELDGKTYSSLYVVQNSSANPSNSTGSNAKGDIPVSGAFVKVAPTKNGTFTVVLNQPTPITPQDKRKTVYFLKDGTAVTKVEEFKTTEDGVIVKSYPVEAGETYYFYASGSKVMIAAIGIKYDAEDTTTAPTTETTSSSTTASTSSSTTASTSSSTTASTAKPTSSTATTAKPTSSTATTAKPTSSTATTAKPEPTTVKPGPTVKLGDVDGSGEITAEDALAILKNVVGISQTTFVKEAADVDGSGEITAEDALAILKHVVGLELIK